MTIRVNNKALDSKIKELVRHCIAIDNFDLNLWEDNDIKKNELVYEIAELLLNEEKIKTFWEDELVISQLERSITRLSREKFLQKDCSKEVIDSVHKILDFNAAEHWLFIPINNESLSKIIEFDRYVFIPKSYSRGRKINKISKLAGLPLEEAAEFAQHTENSRSPDFFRYALFGMKIKHQTSYARSVVVGNMVIFHLYILAVIYFAYIAKQYAPIKGDKFNLLDLLQGKLVKNKHIAVYAKDSWRHGHIPLQQDVDMALPIDWLRYKKYQLKFRELANKFLFEEEDDDFKNIFVQSTLFLKEALERSEKRNEFEHSVLFLFLVVIAESIILPDGGSEKKLRLMALLPRISSINDKPISELVKIVKTVYEARNNFVHAGKNILLRYQKDTEEEISTFYFIKMIAKLIADYDIHLADVNKEIPPNQNLGDRTRIDIWSKQLKQAFEDVISGK